MKLMQLSSFKNYLPVHMYFYKMINYAICFNCHTLDLIWLSAEMERPEQFLLTAQAVKLAYITSNVPTSLSPSIFCLYLRFDTRHGPHLPSSYPFPSTGPPVFAGGWWGVNHTRYAVTFFCFNSTLRYKGRKSKFRSLRDITPERSEGGMYTGFEPLTFDPSSVYYFSSYPVESTLLF